MSMPSPLLPEITLPAAPVPPIVLFDAPLSITTPVRRCPAWPRWRSCR